MKKAFLKRNLGKKKILFVCKHNRFRSKVAEAIFNKLNKNQEIEAESAGIIADEPSVTEIVVELMKERGIEIKNIKSRKFTPALIRNSDLIVIVADNIDKNLFEKYSKEIIVWKISDASALDIKDVENRIDEIQENVKRLTEEMNN